MARHALVRGSIAALISMGLAVGAVSFSTNAVAGTTSEVVIPATDRSTVRGAKLLYAGNNGYQSDGAGAAGVFHTEEGLDGAQWTRYSDGQSFPVTASGLADVTSTTGTGTDALAYYSAASRQVELRDMATDTASTVTIPDGLTFYRTFGSTVTAYVRVTAEDGTISYVWHLLTPAGDGGTRDQIVTGPPDGSRLGASVGGDETSVVFTAVTADGQRRYLLVDPATAAVTSYTAPIAVASTDRYVLLTPDYLGWYTSSGSVTVVPRSDPGAQPTEVAGSTAASREGGYDLAIVGDSLVYQTASGSAIKAVPLTGGTAVTLLAQSTYQVSAASDGTAVAIGGTGVTDWGIRRIVEGADGTPVVTTAKKLPPVPATVQGLAVAQGALVTTDSAAGSRWDYVRTLSAQGPLTYGARTRLTDFEYPVFDCDEGDEGCRALHGLGDGRFARVVGKSGNTNTIYSDGPGAYDWAENSVPLGGKITDANLDYIVYTLADTHTQYVVRVGSATPLQLTATSAALWAGTLWTPGTTAGTVTALDLETTETKETVDTGSGCVPSELQALGRWIYWSCTGSSGTAGVYDRTTKSSVSVPSGQALLGDGYVVSHDKSAGELVLTDVHSGTAVTSTLGDLPDDGTDQRHLRWDVDKFGSRVAYADSSEQVHVVDTGIPAQAITSLHTDKTGTTVDAGTWSVISSYVLSKPAASWTAVIKRKATGKTVDTLTGSATRGRLEVAWEGWTAEENPLPNGAYTWSLTVRSADGDNSAITDSGTVHVIGGEAVWRDFSDDGDDGFGDLFAVTSSGRLKTAKGTGTGTLSKAGNVGPVWEGSAKVVPVGDLTKDGCNDLLVRRSSGNLWRYAGTCGKYDIVESGRVKLGTGFNQYNVLTSPGDITGDGRADLIARKSSNGAVYLYAATSGGKLKSRVKVASDWSGYKKVVGVGDLNGDGYGDLLAQDKSNRLWRYSGNGKGGFKGRVKIASGWGSSYNAVVGVGDITGDGRADLVARDTSGNLYRYAGDGKGSFGARKKIATGWKGYKGLF
ncbi:FG-GAP-like repeat-containing protein [Streptomyces sp. NPDC059373]